MPTTLSIFLTRSLSNISRTNVASRMDQSTLILTQVIFRHGHRTPDQTLIYPGDPYADEPYLPYGRGELTLLGRKQCFAFGQALRSNYSKFLGPEYVSGIIEAKSSEISRARTSLQLVLAGLFPPTPASTIDAQLNWQPVPFTYKPFKEDALIAQGVRNMYQHEDHPDFGKTANSRAIVKCFEEEIKWKLRVQAQCLLVYDTLKTQQDLGFELPAWSRDIFPEKLEEELVQFGEHNFSRKQFVVDGFGHLIKEINDVMINKALEISDNAKKTPRIYLYSGHDINVIGLLAILRQFDPAKWPNYCSNVAFELHHVDGEFLVRMLYQDGPEDARNFMRQEEKVSLRLPGTSEDVCTLKQFGDYVQDYFPSNETEQPKL